jgi:hypothetical protein
VHDVDLDAEFVEEALEVEALGVIAGEVDVALGHEDEVVGGGAEEGGAGGEAFGVEPDILLRGADGEEETPEFLELGEAHAGLIDVEDDGLEVVIGGGLFEGLDEVEVGEGAAGVEGEAEEGGAGLAALGNGALEVVNGDDRFLGGGEGAEEEGGEEESAGRFHGVR